MAFDVWAERCAERLNGMFAFAVWDQSDGSLFLARDRMGQKPLYYTLGEERIAFASELSALKAVSFWNEVGELDEESLVHYLNLGYVGGDRTIYSGVRQLLPSTWSKWNDRQQPYFNRLDFGNESVNAKTTRELCQRAVERQLISDVPLGRFSVRWN